MSRLSSPPTTSPGSAVRRRSGQRRSSTPSDPTAPHAGSWFRSWTSSWLPCARSHGQMKGMPMAEPWPHEAAEPEPDANDHSDDSDFAADRYGTERGDPAEVEEPS